MTNIRKPHTNSFDAQTAVDYGVNEAIMIQNFAFWIQGHLVRHENNHDGRTWAENTQEAFVFLFPFWSKGQIECILESLVEQDVLIKGDNNKTLCYAFKNESLWLDAKMGA